MKKERLKAKFIEELSKIPVVQVACERVVISRQTVYRWRRDDFVFANAWDDALEEGEAFINDMAESQLLQLIKNEHFSAVRYWLSLRHPKFKKEKIEVDRYPPKKKGINPGFYKEWIAEMSDEELIALMREKSEKEDK